MLLTNGPTTLGPSSMNTITKLLATLVALLIATPVFPGTITDNGDGMLTIILFPPLWPLFALKKGSELFRSDPPFVRNNSFQCIMKNVD